MPRVGFWVVSSNILCTLYCLVDNVKLCRCALLCIYVRGLAKMFWPEINGYIGVYIPYGQWPDRSGGACAHASK
jgi:hypothetical protein